MSDAPADPANSKPPANATPTLDLIASIPHANGPSAARGFADGRPAPRLAPDPLPANRADAAGPRGVRRRGGRTPTVPPKAPFV
jgi:hypothetical protein